MHTVAEKVSADDPHTTAALKIISQNSQHRGFLPCICFVGFIIRTNVRYVKRRGKFSFLDNSCTLLRRAGARRTVILSAVNAGRRANDHQHGAVLDGAGWVGRQSDLRDAWDYCDYCLNLQHIDDLKEIIKL